MALTSSGLAAAFFNLVAVGEGYQGVLLHDEANLATGSYPLSLSQTADDGTELRSLDTTITVPGPPGPILRSITKIADRTSALKRVVAAGATAAPAEQIGPRERLDYFLDLSGLLQDGEVLATILSFTPSTAATAAGLMLGDGDDRPAMDVQGAAIEYQLSCSPADATNYVAGVTVQLEISISLVGGKVYDRLISHTIRSA